MPEKILLVDDDPLILQGYRRSLSREFPMETALGGAEALKLATGNAPSKELMAKTPKSTPRPHTAENRRDMLFIPESKSIRSYQNR